MGMGSGSGGLLNRTRVMSTCAGGVEALRRKPLGLEWGVESEDLILWKSSRSLQGGWQDRFHSRRRSKAVGSSRQKPLRRPVAAVNAALCPPDPEMDGGTQANQALARSMVVVAMWWWSGELC